MGIRNEQGFTIIETTLFLAISGILVVTMIAGAGVSLNIQRYRDATESFKSLLQAQYSALNNTQNGRDNNLACDGSAAVTTGTTVRGQSACMLVGRYVRIDQSDITIYNVLARQTSPPPSGRTDVDALINNYVLTGSTFDRDERQMDWQTQIAWPRTGAGARSPITPRTIGVLFIRSPESGSVYTFTDTAIPADKDNVTMSNTFIPLLKIGDHIPGQGGRTICIASGGLLVGADMAVNITAFASSAAAIQTKSNDLTGATSQC